MKAYNKKLHGKLVRDKIPEIMESNGQSPKYVIHHRDFLFFDLGNKLIEESKEVKDTLYSHDPENERLIEEMADLLEAYEALMEVKGLKMKDIKKAKKKKLKERGGFSKGVYLFK